MFGRGCGEDGGSEDASPMMGRGFGADGGMLVLDQGQFQCNPLDLDHQLKVYFDIKSAGLLNQGHSF